LYVSRSDARRHACEAWVLPRNREVRLTALRRGVVGPAPPSCPGTGLWPGWREGPASPWHCCQAAVPGFSYPRLPSAGDATSRSAFRIAS